MQKWDKVLLRYENEDQYLTSKDILDLCGSANKASRVLSMLRERGLLYTNGTSSQTTIKKFYLTSDGIQLLKRLNNKKTVWDFSALNTAWKRNDAR